MLRTVLAGLRYRKARLLLSSVAVALGVAFVAGTLLLNASMSARFYAGFAGGAKNVSALVAAPKSGNPPGQPGGQTVPRQVLGEVRAVPGVAAADGRVIGPAAILGSDGKATGNGFGVNVTAADASLSGFTVVSGHLPAAADQVDVDKATAADQHLLLGQRVRVLPADGVTRTFHLAGILDTGINPDLGSAAVLAFQTPVAFSVTGQSSYAMIVARAAPGVSQAALAASIQARVPGYQVQTGSQFAGEEADAVTHVSKVFTVGLLIFALISLVVACIVIYNTFGILIAQRSREFALLRCVGASRRQVFRGMLAEAAAVGLAASAAGVLAGIGLSAGLGRLITPPGVGPAPLVLQPAALAIAAGTGLAVTVAASALPAQAATRIAPVAALGSLASGDVTRRAGWLRLAVAVLAGSLGLALTAAGTGRTSGTSGLIEIAAGGCVFFVAVLALGPLFTPPVISLLGWLPALLARGVTFRLATANARRNPHRVAATTAALTIGITLMTLFTVVFSSLQASTDASIAGHYPFDYIVAAQGAQPDQPPVPPRIFRALRARPELGMVAAAYSRPAAVDGSQVIVGAYSGNALGVAVRPAMLAGSLTAVGPGTAAVNSRYGSVGGTIVVATPDAGRETLRIVAVYDTQRYRSPLPQVLISAADLTRGFRPAGPDEVVIDAAPGVSPASSRAAVNSAIASDPLLAARTLADYKASLNRQVNSILEMVGALLALAILIALLGISSTLTLSVIERTPESALLRALGLTRGQLRRMLLAEALLMAALAVLLGTGLGAGFGTAIIHAFGNTRGGGAVLSIPYSRLSLYALAAAVAGVAAALLPARRAARTSVVAAITDHLYRTGRGSSLGQAAARPAAAVRKACRARAISPSSVCQLHTDRRIARRPPNVVPLSQASPLSTTRRRTSSVAPSS
jgi:putative ABC transport system permease protein